METTDSQEGPAEQGESGSSVRDSGCDRGGGPSEDPVDALALGAESPGSVGGVESVAGKIASTLHAEESAILEGNRRCRQVEGEILGAPDAP